MPFEKDPIVITGGASGLGLELVRQLITKSRLIVIARPSEALDQLGRDHPEIEIFKADLARQDDVVAAGQAIAARHDRIGGLINNAAVQYTPLFHDAEFEFASIADEVATNFTSPCKLVALMLPKLMQSEHAFIMNINSGLGLVPKTSAAIYCATKGGLNIFSQALANQLCDTNVLVQQAFLPLVDTAMTAGRGQGKLPPDQVAAAIVDAINQRAAITDIGKVKLLRPLAHMLPPLARKIMKSA